MVSIPEVKAKLQLLDTEVELFSDNYRNLGQDALAMVAQARETDARKIDELCFEINTGLLELERTFLEQLTDDLTGQCSRLLGRVFDLRKKFSEICLAYTCVSRASNI